MTLPSRWVRLGGAVLLLLAALLGSFLLGPERRVPVAPLLYLAAGMLAAWFTGPGLGMAVVLTSIPLVDYFWIEPRYSFQVAPHEWPWFAAFILAGLLGWAVSRQRRRFEFALTESRDRLEQRVAERTAELFVSEQRWRQLYETSTVGIAVTDPDGRFLDANGALQHMLGYDLAQLQQLTLTALLISGAARHQGDERAIETPLRRQDGEVLWVSLALSMIPATAHTAPLASVVMVDVTSRRRAEEDWRRAQDELSRASRLTAMGMLAVSIAHEINQPLSAIVTNAQAAGHWLAPATPNLIEAAEAMRRIIRDANHAADIIRSIRQIVAPTAATRQTLSIDDLIRGLLPVVEPELSRQKVRLQLSLSQQPALVSGDPVQLQQVLLNLLLNALDAMREIPGPERRLDIRSLVAENLVTVIVEDRGVGLDAVEIGRLFTPFYSTKPQGMGVGLAICYAIIESHGGRIWAENAPTRGARFLFALPSAEGGTTLPKVMEEL